VAELKVELAKAMSIELSSAEMTLVTGNGEAVTEDQFAEVFNTSSLCDYHTYVRKACRKLWLILVTQQRDLGASVNSVSRFLSDIL